MKRTYADVNGIRMHYLDTEGDGPLVLLVHGLMCRAVSWTQTIEWLRPHHRVVAIDQRGHGWSDKPEHGYTREDYVGDLVAFLERLNAGPALVIGHSMGALNGWVLAAERPDLVCGLVLVDMGVNTDQRPEQEKWRNWFASWPLPFPSQKEVRAFFGKVRPAEADHFMDLFEERDDGFRPIFSFEQMLETRDDFERRNHWAELERIECPTLVVRGGDGGIPRAEMEEMARRIPNGQGRFVEIEGAGHVVHFDQPDVWRNVVESFMKELTEELTSHS
jgi:pimeloyl-ACP methyl ester carboxylesterase